MPVYEDRMDIVNWHLWDTVRFEAGRKIEQWEEFNLFETPRNSKKNYFETSMEQASILPMPQHFNCTSMRPSYGEFNQEYDNKQFKESVMFTFWLGQKIYSAGPMAIFQFWKTPEDLEKLLVEIQRARVLGFKCEGDSLSFLIKDAGPIGLHILQGQQFKLKLSFQYGMTFKEDFKLAWFLDGVIAREVM